MTDQEGTTDDGQALTRGLSQQPRFNDSGCSQLFGQLTVCGTECTRALLGGQQRQESGNSGALCVQASRQIENEEVAYKGLSRQKAAATACPPLDAESKRDGIANEANEGQLLQSAGDVFWRESVQGQF